MSRKRKMPLAIGRSLQCDNAATNPIRKKRKRNQTQGQTFTKSTRSGAAMTLKVQYPQSSGYLYGRVPVMPTREDFGGEYGFLNANDYVWGQPETSREEATAQLDPNLRASPPSIPDGSDVSPLPFPRGPRFRKPIVKKKSAAEPAKQRPPAKSKLSKQPDLVRPWTYPHVTYPVPKPSLQNMPAELRLQLYRWLLVSDKPIQVYNGWSMVYKRHKPGLDISILLLCKKFYYEGLTVLYGENVFLYRLRDAAPPIINIDNLAYDEPTADDQGNDPDYRERPRRTRAAARARRTLRDIDVGAFKHLFRHLIVEAEGNRFSRQTQRSMVAAISTFRYKKPKDPSDTSLDLNICSLTIRVAPLRNQSNVAAGEDPFTFTNFFKQRSAVIRAIRAVDCQMLYVELMFAQAYVVPEPKNVRLKIDRRHCRISRCSRSRTTRSSDMWRKDKAMLALRRQRINRSSVALDNLRHDVLELCESRVSGTVGGEAFEDWDEFSDTEDEV